MGFQWYAPKCITLKSHLLYGMVQHECVTEILYQSTEHHNFLEHIKTERSTNLFGSSSHKVGWYTKEAFIIIQTHEWMDT